MGRLASKPDRRRFEVVRLPGEDGRSIFAARIVCGSCGSYSDHATTGINNDTYFERHGWLVGKNASRDRCPACRRNAARGRATAFGEVIKRVDEIMTKIQEKPEPQAAASPEVSREMSREDGRLLSRTIEDHWDEQSTSYKIGWSDQRVADDLSVPPGWVKAIRERDFGGNGEEPGLALFLAEQVAVKREIGELNTVMSMVTKDLENSTMFQQELARKMDGYRNGHRRLLERIEKIDGLVITIKQGRG